MSTSRLGAVLGALVVLAGPARAQGPAVAPPASSSRTDGRHVHELLPDLGIIGAQVGVAGALCANPYEAGRGPCGGGFIVLPLAHAFGGRLSYQIDVTLARSRSAPFTITSPLAYLANLAAGAPPAAAAVGPPGAPFPVRREVRTELRILQVSPFGLRYSFAARRVPTVRPYLGAGIDAVVVLATQEPVRREIADPVGSAALDQTLIGGISAQSPELAALGLPSGQGNLRVGAHAAIGAELRLSPRLSANGEYRLGVIEGAGSPQHVLQAALGFHW
jgi:hypothetical protein